MATITELLQDRVDAKKTTDAIMEFRVVFQNLKNVADDTAAAADAIVNGDSFADVHADLKAEGQACRVLLSQLVHALAGHGEFIDFKPE